MCYARINVLNLQSKKLSVQLCSADPTHGYPKVRKDVALNSTEHYIFMAGGEHDFGGGNMMPLTDYWALDLLTFKWHRLQGEMVVPLIEPHLVKAYSGSVYLWG